jgi:hypothetical protein
MRFLFILLLLLSSCTPQRRLERLLKKHPELTNVDSVVIRDTIRIIVPKVRIDTVVNIEELWDTIYLEKDQLAVKVWRDRYNKVYIQGQCDTVFVEKIIDRKVPVKIYEETPLWKKVFYWILAIIIAFLAFYIIVNAIFRK